MTKRRVGITGAGPVSSIGIGCDAFFEGVGSSAVGIKPASLTELDGLPVGEITDFDVEEYLETPKTYLDRSSEFAFAAVSLAMADAGLDPDSLDRERTGLMLGSAYGSFGTMELFFRDVLDKGPKFAKPFLFPHTYSNTAISLLAIEYGLTGPHLNFASGFVSAAHAMIAAYDLICLGRVDTAFAGGYESLSAALVRAYLLGDVCGKPGGTAIGEGAGIVVLEELEHAAARKARVYAEVVRAEMGSGAHTGESHEKSITDIKPMIGETMGAGAALQTIAALISLGSTEAGTESDSVLVSSTDPGGASANLLLRKP